MYLVFPVIVIVIVTVIVLLQCLSCSFGQNQKVNIADIIMTMTMTMTKNQDTKSVLKHYGRNKKIYLEHLIFTKMSLFPKHTCFHLKKVFPPLPHSSRKILFPRELERTMKMLLGQIDCPVGKSKTRQKNKKYFCIIKKLSSCF